MINNQNFLSTVIPRNGYKQIKCPINIIPNNNGQFKESLGDFME